MKKWKKIKIYEIKKNCPGPDQTDPFKTVTPKLSHSIWNCPRLYKTILVHIKLIHLNCPDNLKPLGPNGWTQRLDPTVGPNGWVQFEVDQFHMDQDSFAWSILSGPDFLNGSVLYDLRYFIWTWAVKMGHFNMNWDCSNQFHEKWISLLNSIGGPDQG